MKHIILVPFFLFSIAIQAQQKGVKISQTIGPPSISSILEIESTDKGVLLPRVGLTSRDNPAPIATTPQNSLLVYNLVSSGIGTNAVTPGFYYWSTDSSKWIRLLTEIVNTTSTDDQNLIGSSITGTTLKIDIENGTSTSVNLQPIIDSAIANSPGTDDQNLTGASITGTTLTINIENGASTSVDLQPIIDSAQSNSPGTDDQNLTGASIIGTTLKIDIENGNSVTVDLDTLLGDDWHILGNAGTSAAVNFLGTTDNNALTFRVNNDFAGTLGIGANGNTYYGHRSNFSQNGTGGLRNIGIGYEALLGPTTGISNIAIGRYAMQNNAGGSNNIGIGQNSLANNGGGSNNIAIGENTLLNSGISGGGPSSNIAIGKNAMLNSGTGGGGPLRNVVIGENAMQDLGIGGAGPIGTTGIGYSVSATNNPSNSTAIGNQSNVNASNQIRIGNASVNSIGGYAAWSNLSDARYKNNVQENVPGLAFINKLKPVTYQLDVIKINQLLRIKDSLMDKESALAKSKEIQTGFIAQDVEKAANELNFTFSGIDKPSNEDGHYSLRYAEFVVPLVKAVQEQNELIIKQQQTIEKIQKETDERIKKLEQILFELKTSKKDLK